MTDYGQDAEPTDPTEPAASEDTGEVAGEADGGPGDFSTGEGLVTLAGFVLLGVWLIFEVITDDYGLSHLAIALAATAVILPRVDREKVEAFHPLGSLMKVLGYAIAIVGASEIITDLETGIYGDFMTVLGALLAYAGFVVAFLGARSIKT